jgi:hypothetical protein
MTFFEVVDHMLTRESYICENANIHMIASDHKTVWVAGIVKFWKCANAKITNNNWLVGKKLFNKRIFNF